MFTGIVDHCGEILSVQRESDRARIWVQCQFNGLQLGESIAIDGGCLTVVDIKPNAFACEISPETMRLTISQQYENSQRVNLERALLINDRLGGHLVSGHIDQMIFVDSLQPHNEFLEMRFKGINLDNYSYLVQKGSVAVNGVSLTVNEIIQDGFSLMLIPHTLERTNLHALKEGQSVNIEFDLVAKMISKQIQPYLKNT
ncbi:riboflavin synthase [Candidiatus Paracoxiella cheracis]|uniref:riboflavin synthase n=1 Tax=Candidiatus Paracoxiella cheracis TaxID=3405120 RepID=UPI003BF5C27B